MLGCAAAFMVPSRYTRASGWRRWCPCDLYVAQSCRRRCGPITVEYGTVFAPRHTMLQQVNSASAGAPASSLADLCLSSVLWVLPGIRDSDEHSANQHKRSVQPCTSTRGDPVNPKCPRDPRCAFDASSKRRGTVLQISVPVSFSRTRPGAKPPRVRI